MRSLLDRKRLLDAGTKGADALRPSSFSDPYRSACRIIPGVPVFARGARSSRLPSAPLAHEWDASSWRSRGVAGGVGEPGFQVVSRYSGCFLYVSSWPVAATARRHGPYADGASSYSSFHTQQVVARKGLLRTLLSGVSKSVWEPTRGKKREKKGTRTFAWGKKGDADICLAHPRVSADGKPSFPEGVPQRG